MQSVQHHRFVFVMDVIMDRNVNCLPKDPAFHLDVILGHRIRQNTPIKSPPCRYQNSQYNYYDNIRSRFT